MTEVDRALQLYIVDVIETTNYRSHFYIGRIHVK